MFDDNASGRHRKEGPELPSFTGDVPKDVVLTSRLYRDRVLTALAKVTTSIVTCLFLALITAGVLAGATGLLPAGLGEHPAAPVAYVALAALATVASLLPKLPGLVRLLCGAFAYGFAFLAVMTQYTGSPVADPRLVVAGTVSTWCMVAVYSVVAGRRLTRYARSRGHS